MKKPFAYLLKITKEIEEATIFPFAEEEWAVKAKIEEGSTTYIKLLDKELTEYLYGDLKSKRVALTDDQIQELENARKEAMNKAHVRFGTLD